MSVILNMHMKRHHSHGVCSVQDVKQRQQKQLATCVSHEQSAVQECRQTATGREVTFTDSNIGCTFRYDVSYLP